MTPRSGLASTSNYALEGTKISLNFVAQLADGLPLPIKGIINAVQTIMNLVDVSCLGACCRDRVNIFVLPGCQSE